ncbi:MAG TPA: hypothetical protein VME21_12925, partial [Steroidobacteraceae bacterium]|nr:hypothetical protein [Steroidobacteraceae bacterium]
MENRAKERLTGAVILVALIVLLVPELFSGRARAPVSGAGGTEQAPLSSYTFGLGDDSRGAPGHGPGAMLTSASEAASAAPASSGAASMPPVPSPHPAAASAASSAAASVTSSAPSVGKSAPSGRAT